MKDSMDKLKSWGKNHGLKCSYAERNGDGSLNYFKDDKNDCRMYSKNSVGCGSVDKRPHLSVWLYDNFASVVFCVEDENIISVIKNNYSNVLVGKEYQDDKLMHYKLVGQGPDVKIKGNASYIEDIINKLDDLYAVVKIWL